MKIVTGAAGFIGSNLVASLEKRGCNIIACDWFNNTNKMLNLRKRQLSHFVLPEDLFVFLNDNRQNIDVIYLLGAVSSTTETNQKLILKTNVELPKNIWNWCKENDTRLIYASSAATYGDGEFGFDDDYDVKKLVPLNLYGKSKNEFDIWVSEQVGGGIGLPPQWAGLKFFNVYGPNEYHKGKQMSVVPQIFRQIISEGRAQLFKSHNELYQDGGQLRDFIWVEDCVDIMLWLDDNPNIMGLFNCGTGQARSFFDLASVVFAAMGRDVLIDYKPTPMNIRKKYQYFTEADMKKIRSLGYTKDFASLEEGVTMYVQNYLMAKDKYL